MTELRWLFDLDSMGGFDHTGYTSARGTPGADQPGYIFAAIDKRDDSSEYQISCYHAKDECVIQKKEGRSLLKTGALFITGEDAARLREIMKEGDKKEMGPVSEIKDLAYSSLKANGSALPLIIRLLRERGLDKAARHYEWISTLRF